MGVGGAGEQGHASAGGSHGGCGGGCHGGEAAAALRAEAGARGVGQGSGRRAGILRRTRAGAGNRERRRECGGTVKTVDALSRDI